jgi:histone acetyltransferase HTATIP
LSTLSLYNRSDVFQESAKQSIALPESAQTVGALLDEMYDTYNSTTGSLFTNFALRPEIEKERTMASLLELFIAADKVRDFLCSFMLSQLTCDQYNLEKVKRKVSEAIMDRFPFIKDALIIVDMATNMYHEQFPYIDGGLRRAVMVQIDARLPAILEDENAWDELSDTKTVLKALHEYQCALRDDGPSNAAVTPPVAPISNEKKRRVQDGSQ